MVQGDDIFSTKMIKSWSLRDTKMARTSLQRIRRKCIAIPRDANEVSEKDERER